PTDYLDDVRALGELWQQALMAASPMSSAIVGHAADPNPEARWTLAEISAALDSPGSTAPQATPLPVPASADSEPPIPAAAVAGPSIPVSDDAPGPPQSLPARSERAASQRYPAWTFVGAGRVLILVLAVNRSRLADFKIQSSGAAVPAPAAMPAIVPGPLEPKVPRP